MSDLEKINKSLELLEEIRQLVGDISSPSGKRQDSYIFLTSYGNLLNLFQVTKYKLSEENNENNGNQIKGLSTTNR